MESPLCVLNIPVVLSPSPPRSESRLLRFESVFLNASLCFLWFISSYSTAGYRREREWAGEGPCRLQTQRIGSSSRCVFSYRCHIVIGCCHLQLPSWVEWKCSQLWWAIRRLCFPRSAISNLNRLKDNFISTVLSMLPETQQKHTVDIVLTTLEGR